MIHSLRKFIVHISGAEPAFTLEHRLFNISSLFITAFAMIAVIINYVIGLETQTIWLGLAGALASLLLYYIARFRAHFSLSLIFVYVFITAGILGSIYFYNDGMNGTTMYVFMMLLNIFVLVMPQRYQYWVFGIMYASIVVLLALEYYHPDLVVPYHSREEQVLDYASCLFYTMLFSTVVIVASRRSFYNEREKVLCQNAELKLLNEQIEQQRQALEEAVLLANQRHANIEMLLNELNHRVKNNLQVVSSLLKLQAHSVSDEKAKFAILESKNRLLSMILVHKRLYHNENTTQIFMPEYLQELSESIMRTYSGTLDEKLVSYSVEPVWMQVEKVIPIGLISNELITNCFKHTINKKPGGKIAVKLEKKENQHLLTVSDNGTGFLDTEQSKTFGLRLVKSLVTQLNGTYKITSENGTCWEIYFN